MAKVLGFGVGVFVLAFLWMISLIAAVILTRSQGIDGAIGPLVIAILTTLILVFFPRDSPSDAAQIDVRVLDYAFILRMLLLTFMCLVLLISFIILVFVYWSKPIVAKPVKQVPKLR